MKPCNNEIGTLKCHNSMWHDDIIRKSIISHFGLLLKIIKKWAERRAGIYWNCHPFSISNSTRNHVRITNRLEL